MKSFITIVSFFLLSIAIIGRVDGNLINDLIQKLDIFPIKDEVLQFEEFIHRFSKPYRNDFNEKLKRFKIFLKNLEKIRDLNQHEQGTAVYGVTSFTDLTYEEFQSIQLGYKPHLYQSPEPSLESLPEFSSDEPLPESFDWRMVNGVVSEVKNQEMCGSCWAFSATGNIEGVWAVRRNESISLSEQELVDCDTLDQGCGGGLPTNAFKTIIRLGGIESESDYPYEGANEKCHFNRKLSHVKIDSYVELPKKNETFFQRYLVANGPISIGLNANAMQFYFGGISHPPNWLCNPNNLDHGVLIVGYGTGKTRILHRTLPYWIVKNSWGKTWGEKGYYRVYRGGDTCGLTQMASSAVVN